MKYKKYNIIFSLYYIQKMPKPKLTPEEKKRRKTEREREWRETHPHYERDRAARVKEEQTFTENMMKFDDKLKKLQQQEEEEEEMELLREMLGPSLPEQNAYLNNSVFDVSLPEQNADIPVLGKRNHDQPSSELEKKRNRGAAEDLDKINIGDLEEFDGGFKRKSRKSRKLRKSRRSKKTRKLHK